MDWYVGRSILAIPILVLRKCSIGAVKSKEKLV